MTTTPTIDYTNKDFQSLREAMLNLARYRLPEWTDRSPSDLGVLLVDLFAYMGDVILYYQDRIANESFLATAVERRSVLNALRLIGYELAPPIPAHAELTLFFNLPPNGTSPKVTIDEGKAVFYSNLAGAAPQRFEYLGPSLEIDLSTDQTTEAGTKRTYAGLPVVQCGQKSTVEIGSSAGEPNQAFRIPAAPVILDTLVVEVNEGTGWVTWDRRDSLFYDSGADGRVNLSNAEGREYYVQYDESDVCWVIFGDGTYGRRPPNGTNNIRATFRVGGGKAGNVPANTITNCNETKSNIGLLDSVTNLNAAAGGADHEDIVHAKRFGPLTFRSGQRAVTLSDYVALTHQAGGVAKVRGGAPNWNTIKLYVAPEGDTCRPVPEVLRRQLMSYFEDRRMAGTLVEIHNAVPAHIDITIELVCDRRYHAEAVRQGAEAAVKDLLAFKNVDFGQTVYLSDIYGRVEAVPGVIATTVTLLRRSGSPAAAIKEEDIASLAAQLVTESGKPSPLPLRTGAGGALDLATLIRRALQVDVDSEGRILINEFEIPTLGTLIVKAPRPGGNKGDASADLRL
jgi:hypothetical protein